MSIIMSRHRRIIMKDAVGWLIGIALIAIVVMAFVGLRQAMEKCAAKGGHYIYNENGRDVCIKKELIIEE